MQILISRHVDIFPVNEVISHYDKYCKERINNCYTDNIINSEYGKLWKEIFEIYVGL